MKKERLRRMKAEQWAWFAEQSAEMLLCGVPLREALTILSKSEWFPRAQIKRVLGHLEQGVPFSQALERAGFSALFVALIAAAEVYGGYVQALQELARHYRQQALLTARLKQASTYPLLVLLLTLLAFFFLLFFVLPQFRLLYEAMQVELPWWTWMLLHFGQLLQRYGWLFPLLMTGILVLGWLMVRTRIGIPLWQTVIYRLPGIGRWLKLRNSHYLVQQLGLMLKNGVSLDTACTILAISSPWAGMRQVFEGIKRELERGCLFSQSLAAYRQYFDPMLPEILVIAEESGRLAAVLELLRERFAQRIVHENQLFVKLFEPILIFFVGSVMGFMMVSLFIPMFHLGTK